MYLSNSNVSFRGVIVVLCIATLSACSSLPNKDDNQKDSKVVSQKASAKSDDSLQQADREVSKSSVSVSDPMADIKINSEVRKSYSQVAKLVSSENYDQAIDLLNSVQVSYPQLSGPAYQKARIFYSQEKYEQALVQIEESLKLNQRNYYAFELKGIVLRAMGDFKNSKQAYIKGIELYPNYPNIHLNLGVLADIYLRELPLAVSHYQKYMDLTDNKDKKVSNWLVEIKRRINSEQTHE